LEKILEYNFGVFNMGWVGLILTPLYYKPDSTHSTPLTTLYLGINLGIE